MITDGILYVIVQLLNIIFGIFPTVSTLPNIGNFDIDSALVTGISEARTFFVTFWPFAVVFEGFLFLLGYYSLKLILKLLLGSRTPTAN